MGGRGPRHRTGDFFCSDKTTFLRPYSFGFKHMEKSSRWAIRAIKPLKSYASGSVILLGDAV